MRPATSQEWADLLTAVARTAPSPDGPLRLGSMEPVVRAALRATAAGTTAPDPTPLPGTGEGTEWAAWHALLSGDAPPEALFDAFRPTLLARDDYTAIEVWTDAELCVMHALWFLARRDGDRRAAARLDTVRTWHLAHTQPDNATNRPWALHVFALGAEPESQLYAQTLLHNAMALDARPTALAGLILASSAGAMRLSVLPSPSSRT